MNTEPLAPFFVVISPMLLTALQPRLLAGRDASIG